MFLLKQVFIILFSLISLIAFGQEFEDFPNYDSLLLKKLDFNRESSLYLDSLFVYDYDSPVDSILNDRYYYSYHENGNMILEMEYKLDEDNDKWYGHMKHEKSFDVIFVERQ